MNYEVGERRRGKRENQHQLFPFPVLQGRWGVVCASTVNPIKMKLITKGKHTQKGGVIRGWGMIVVQRARLQMEKRDKQELKELRVCQIVLLFCPPPPRVSGKAAGVKEEMPPRPL